MKLILSLLLLIPCLAKANEPILLSSNNTVVFRGQVNDASVADAQLRLLQVAMKRGAKSYPIYLVLDSPGGSIDAGQGFIQYAKMFRDVKTISIFAASMASAIVEALPGERLITENGVLMFHQAYAGVEGTLEVGSLESRLYMMKKTVLRMEVANSTRMKMNLGDYKALIARELWLDSDDSIRYRAADRVVDLMCMPELIATTDKLTVQSFFGSSTYTFSRCPLFRIPISAVGANLKYKIPGTLTK
jgi:ATP-dependent protease ClpP protease subunit